MSFAIRTVRRLLTSRFAAPLFRPLMRSRAAVFMLHRFAMPDAGVEGHDPSALRASLALLRERGYELVALDTLFDDLLHGRTRRRPAVAFTIDDGYLDQALVGAPIFAEYDCPVTTFVTSGFLDRQLWFWWDRIAYIFEHTTRDAFDVALGTQVLSYERGASWAPARNDFTARCKEVPDAVKHVAIEHLATMAAVELPASAPQRYAPMSWDELRAAEQGGMSFGPHTVTHPILARATDVQSQLELVGSWRRLKAEARRPVPIFCYPNGRLVDLGEREVATLRALDFTGAVVNETGYAERLDANGGTNGTDPFRLRRFAYADDAGELLQIASGVEHVNQMLRGR